MLALTQRSTLIMRGLVFCLLLSVTVQGADQTYIISDGQSLKDGLDIFEEFQGGTRRVTWEETVRASTAVTYAQAFAKACYLWQHETPNQAPFHLPSPLMADQFAKIAQKYLKEHP